MLTYNEVEKYILDIPKFSKKTDSKNMLHIMHLVDVKVFSDMKIIHVAGTNGKGSVCSFLTYILLNSGASVGTFVSPHLVDMTERIKVNNNDISKEDFVSSFTVIKHAIDSNIAAGGAHPSFFEILFLMAMYIYRKKSVDFVILETGLGGRLDATNVFEHPLISVITSISMDHMEILGDTIEKIANEKAGIIKDNVPVVYYGENKAVAEVIEKQADLHNCLSRNVTLRNILGIEKGNNRIAFSTDCGYDKYDNLTVSSIARYQVANAMLAIAVADVLRHECGVRISDSDIRKGIANMHWQARMEMKLPGLYIDGAHNHEGIDEFINTVNDINTKGRKILLFSAVKEKEYDTMIADIVNKATFDVYYIAPLHNGRALTKDILSDTFSRYTDDDRIHAYDDVKSALFAAIQDKSETDVLFCAGSLYLAGEVISLLDKEKEGNKND